MLASGSAQDGYSLEEIALDMLFLRVFAFAVTASATALVEQRELQEVQLGKYKNSSFGLGFKRCHNFVMPLRSFELWL